jgi:hypothetical protein
MARASRATGLDASPFAPARPPSAPELEAERAVRYLLVSGRQDDGLWGTIGALWLSRDGRRGGFLVHPWGIDEGTEMARSHRNAIARGFTPQTIFDYWAKEVWTGANVLVDEERAASTLLLVNELLAVL